MSDGVPNKIMLRDYFAGIALAAMLPQHRGQVTVLLARKCYKVADKMLIERDKPKREKKA